MPGQLCRTACPHTSSEVIRRPSANGRRYSEGPHMRAFSGHGNEADTRTRTGDPFITSEVLYQLSYVGRGCGG
jgi:hypothetical protein